MSQVCETCRHFKKRDTLTYTDDCLKIGSAIPKGCRGCPSWESKEDDWADEAAREWECSVKFIQSYSRDLADLIRRHFVAECKRREAKGLLKNSEYHPGGFYE